MEEILKQIIQIDKNAREIAKEEKYKKQNLDDFIENEYRTKKSVLDLEYKDEIEKQKNKYNKLLDQKKTEIENKVKKEISNIEVNYNKKENDIIKDIIKSIKAEEN